VKNVTDKEFGLLKGALRRVFSRSDLRKAALERVLVEHSDPDRPRVKKWGRCQSCSQIHPAYKMDVDHKDPIVPVTRRQTDMTVQELADRIFCDLENLQVLCETCHNAKSKAENAERRKNFPVKRKGKSPCVKP
jgi:5-methylcytosine-specific restriction endonuclease McrA